MAIDKTTVSVIAKLIDAILNLEQKVGIAVTSEQIAKRKAELLEACQAGDLAALKVKLYEVHS